MSVSASVRVCECICVSECVHERAGMSEDV